jgi:hypothetical protein
MFVDAGLPTIFGLLMAIWKILNKIRGYGFRYSDTVTKAVLSRP